VADAFVVDAALFLVSFLILRLLETLVILLTSMSSPTNPTGQGHKSYVARSNFGKTTYGKRLRAQHQYVDEEEPKRNKPRLTHNPIFGVSSSTPALDASKLVATSTDSGGPESPIEQTRIARDYGDRFVPNREAGDMRTNYHLMGEGGPSTPMKNRIIPSESDAIKGAQFCHSQTRSSMSYLPPP
jgi:hypothetical protein